MAYDDIASANQNPFPGQVFNKPSPKGTPGVDVYKNVVIDYKGDAVTPDNFIKVLTGDETPPPPPEPSTCTGPFAQNKTTCPANTTCCCTDHGLFGCKSDAWQCCNVDTQTCAGSKGCQSKPPPTPGPAKSRVLKSTNASRVFVNFVDHGGSGIIAFPSKQMSSKTLIDTLKTMHQKGMYKELVFYMEACESGSMFQDLPPNINIFATTAADATEPSWGTYCSNQAVVNGKNLNTCLGDLYSVSWMEDADLETPGETLAQQYEDVKKRTNKSHVTEFGTKSITSEPVTNFYGNTSDANGRSDEKAALEASEQQPSTGAGVTVDS